MIEKTIFIVKPIYIPVEVPSGKTGKAAASAAAAEDASANFPLTGKKKIKVKKKQ